MRISNNPVDALFGGVLVVGVELEDGGARVYLVARHRNLHVHLLDPFAQEVVEAWNSSSSMHLYASEVPRDAWCGCSVKEVKVSDDHR